MKTLNPHISAMAIIACYKTLTHFGIKINCDTGTFKKLFRRACLKGSKHKALLPNQECSEITESKVLLNTTSTKQVQQQWFVCIKIKFKI